VVNARIIVEQGHEQVEQSWFQSRQPRYYRPQDIQTFRASISFSLTSPAEPNIPSEWAGGSKESRLGAVRVHSELVPPGWQCTEHCVHCSATNKAATRAQSAETRTECYASSSSSSQQQLHSVLDNLHFPTLTPLPHRCPRSRLPCIAFTSVRVSSDSKNRATTTPPTSSAPPDHLHSTTTDSHYFGTITLPMAAPLAIPTPVPPWPPAQPPAHMLLQEWK